MTAETLTRFSTQLAHWIEQKLETSSYPFRRVEALASLPNHDPELLPGLVLWINRSSLLAGGLLLFPVDTDEDFLRRATTEAAACGLKQFVTWGAREIIIWDVDGHQCKEFDRQHLPAAQKVTATDFTEALDDLLSTLKHLCVTAALPADQLPATYFTRLCLMVRRDLEPDLTESAHLHAGVQVSDQQVHDASHEKSWLTLWRLLALLWFDRLTPGVAPERLEQAMNYLLDDLLDASSPHLAPNTEEPPLNEISAVRFHQTANRLRQLQWGAEPARARQVVELLLDETARQLQLQSEEFPWEVAPGTIRVNLLPPRECRATALVAPSAYLAGLELTALITGLPDRRTCTSDVFAVKANDIKVITANLHDIQPLSRNDYERRLVELRQAWPNQRLRLPRTTPGWIWEALHLCGQSLNAGQLHLLLPSDWVHASGVQELWSRLQQQFQIQRLGLTAEGTASLHLDRAPSLTTTVELYRHDGMATLPRALFQNQPASLTQLLLTAPPEVLELFASKQLIPTDTVWPEDLGGLETAAALFLHSSLGQILDPNASREPSPETPEASRALILEKQIPLPPAVILSCLTVFDWTFGQERPSRNHLDRELAMVMAPLPDLEITDTENPTANRRHRYSSPQLKADIIATAFRDGLPRFPEHYLMRHYRPELSHYDLPGPLSQQDMFFDRILLCGPDGFELEVSSPETARALTIASRMGQTEISLPTDPELTAEILTAYRDDLKDLWDSLLRECRRRVQNRQSALSMARRIWREQGLLAIEELN